MGKVSISVSSRVGKAGVDRTHNHSLLLSADGAACLLDKTVSWIFQSPGFYLVTSSFTIRTERDALEIELQNDIPMRLCGRGGKVQFFEFMQKLSSNA